MIADGDDDGNDDDGCVYVCVGDTAVAGDVAVVGAFGFAFLGETVSPPLGLGDGDDDDGPE